MNNKLYLSNSSIQTFISCKRKFKYRYLDKLPCQTNCTNKYLSFGQSIHQAMAQFNRITDENYRTIDILQNLLRKYWIRDGYESIEDEKKFGQKGLKILSNYLSNPLDLSEKTLIIEEMIKYDFDDKFILCGKIDKAFINSDKRLEITDYKTGDKIEHSEEFKIDLQLPIYILLAEHRLNKCPQVVSYYYLNHNKKIVREIQNSHKEEIFKYLHNISKQIKEEKNFPCSPTEHCQTSCEYYDKCDYEKTIGLSIVNEIQKDKENGIISTVF